MNRTEKERLELVELKLLLVAKLAKNTSEFIRSYRVIQNTLKEVEENQEVLKLYSQAKKIYSLSEKISDVKLQLENVMKQLSFIK